jgi:hypothetical protein
MLDTHLREMPSISFVWVWDSVQLLMSTWASHVLARAKIPLCKVSAW